MSGKTDKTNKPKTTDDYQGADKWCFAIVLNRACDNYMDNPHLFSESLLRFEAVNRRDWFDAEIRTLIVKMDTEDPSLRPHDPEKVRQGVNYSPVNRRLNNVRNYFSHYYHQPFPLKFEKDDPIRTIMEKAYEKARFEEIKRQYREPSITFPVLFDEKNQITPAGIIFLASFFVERRILARLMGYVGGFKKTEGEYTITRDIFTTYCLKDSYSIHTQDAKDILFRDIMGYLSRVPSEFYKYNKDLCDKEGIPERKTDKFITFALQYLETFAAKEAGEYRISAGRMKIVREERKVSGKDEDKFKPCPNKGKIKVLFDTGTNDLPYYINHNTAILQFQKSGESRYRCKIGINELKYLVLLCIQGKTKDAAEALYRYLLEIQERFKDPSTRVGADEPESLKRRLPRFIRLHSNLEAADHDAAITARYEHIYEKWNKKRDKDTGKMADAKLHQKARDILRYIKWHINRPLSTGEYNFLLALLIEKNFDKFDERITELGRTERITQDICGQLRGEKSLDSLYQKVHVYVLDELQTLKENDISKLAEFIGVTRTPADNAPTYENKVNAFIAQPMICKGFLRDHFFGTGKTFAKLVENQLGTDPDVPLGKQYYHVTGQDRFSKDNAVLYETLALDRLCVMMARKCFADINTNLRAQGQELRWIEKDGKECIELDIRFDSKFSTAGHVPPSDFGETLNIPQMKTRRNVFTIRFDRKHYTKLYVKDDAEFLAGLMQYFFPDETVKDYHLLYSDGINRYTELQRQAITSLFELEGKIIERAKMNKDNRYINFRDIMKKSGFSGDEQRAVKTVRNSLLHYELKFTLADFRIFERVMSREKMNKDWILKVK